MVYASLWGMPDRYELLSPESNTSVPYALMVEDDVDLRVGVLLFLQESHYKVIGVSNGLEALKVLVEAYNRHHLPSVILLDLNMPVMTGWELLTVCQTVCKPEVCAVPIYLTTGENIPPNSRYGILKKPYSVEQLLGIMRKHCGTPNSNGEGSKAQ